ncbi:hypothetical protein MsAm2_04440 [Methanolapillus ohkumae]|uniref:Uncharacterized protein n=1 Tax=Methanolapillus ohkumae TaxID=3028298 RepID=A0AA96VHL7_9EURY|nr:hypothetical protein MsAm2_04440 [Methanosarcinaceae archaeon Am2]
METKHLECNPIYDITDVANWFLNKEIHDS